MLRRFTNNAMYRIRPKTLRLSLSLKNRTSVNA